MNMMAFFTHSLKNAANNVVCNTARIPAHKASIVSFISHGKHRLCFLWRALVLGLWFLIPAFPAWAVGAEIVQLRTEIVEDSIVLTAQMRFELPPVVQETLLKGIPMFFVLEADIYRERWYWTDVRVASSARTIRLAYQPLTLRWRINIASGLSISNSVGLRATLNQNFDTLAEALAGLQRVSRWRIADAADIEGEASGYRLDYRFRLDLTQLPRPFQIGVAGQREWVIDAQQREPLRLLPAVPALPAVSIQVQPWMMGELGVTNLQVFTHMSP